jgi:S-DNA-T family DNA segregation ATPase FtsK/SpoIIIE
LGDERATSRPPGQGVLVRRGQPGALIQVALLDERDAAASASAAAAR